MLGFAALLDESIANAARFIIRRFAGRKIGPAPKVIVHDSGSIGGDTSFGVYLGANGAGLYDPPQTPWVNWHSAACSAEQCVCSTYRAS